MKKEMLRRKKTLALAILLSTLLLANMLLFVVQGSTNSDSKDGWSADSIDDDDGYALIDAVTCPTLDADVSFGCSSSEGIWCEINSNFISPAVSNTSELSGENNSILPVGSNQYGDLSYLFINEFMADNGITVAGPDGNSPDWIELFNAGNITIDLSGMYLTDDLTDPTCWQFPEGTTIGPSEYLIVWADRDGGEIYASFGLDANGEEIGLFDSDGETLIDSVEFVKQLQDVSYGRIPDGGSSWNYLLSATPGLSNQDPSVEAQSSVWSLVLLIIVFVVAGISIFFVSKIKARMNK